MQLINKGNLMNSVKLMHLEIRRIGPTIVTLFRIWHELSATQIAEIPQICLNLIEISEDRQGSLFVIKTRYKTF